MVSWGGGRGAGSQKASKVQLLCVMEAVVPGVKAPNRSVAKGESPSLRADSLNY